MGTLTGNIKTKSAGKKLLLMAALFVLGQAPAFCNTDTRNWTMVSGEKMHAELVYYDLEKKVATLRHRDNTETEYPLDAFSAVDQAWLVEWGEFSDELDYQLENIKGAFTHYQTEDRHATDFYVYTPSTFQESAALPMLILLHPSGKGARYVMRFMEAAETLGVIVVSTDGNRNTKGDEQVAAAQFERFKDLLVSIEKTIPHDGTRLFLGGSSGGALRAYHYSAKIQRPWAGIFANGGWLGPDGTPGLELPYPSTMRVAMVNGNNDRNANHFVDRDTKILKKRGCEVGLFAFEGGHQIPPPLIQIKVLEWLMRLTDEVYASPVTPGNEPGEAVPAKPRLYYPPVNPQREPAEAAGPTTEPHKTEISLDGAYGTIQYTGHITKTVFRDYTEFRVTDLRLRFDPTARTNRVPEAHLRSLYFHLVVYNGDERTQIFSQEHMLDVNLTPEAPDHYVPEAVFNVPNGALKDGELGGLSIIGYAGIMWPLRGEPRIWRPQR